MEHGHDAGHFVLLLHARDDRIVRVRPISVRELKFTLRRLRSTASTLSKQIDEFGVRLANGVRQWLVLDRIRIEPEQSRRRLVGHEQLVRSIHNHYGVAKAVQNGLHVAFLPLGELRSELKVLQFTSELPNGRIAVFDTVPDRMGECSHGSRAAGVRRQVRPRFELCGYGRDRPGQSGVAQTEEDHAHSPNAVNGKTQRSQPVAPSWSRAGTLQFRQDRSCQRGNHHTGDDPYDASLAFHCDSSDPHDNR